MKTFEPWCTELLINIRYRQNTLGLCLKYDKTVVSNTRERIVDGSPWITLIGFIGMHYILGMATAVIFQLAHIMPEVEYPLANEDGTLDNNWAVHQMATTTNFAPNNRLLSWYVGGLNFQVEHHLFPNICHVHYRKISEIVKQTAQEYGVPYNSIDRFREAIAAHAKMLRDLGNAPQIAM